MCCWKRYIDENTLLRKNGMLFDREKGESCGAKIILARQLLRMLQGNIFYGYAQRRMNPVCNPCTKVIELIVRRQEVVW